MQPTSSDPPTVLCSMSGVILTRYGLPNHPDARYLVTEPGHRAAFSRLSSIHPLRDALRFLIDRANWRYHATGGLTCSGSSSATSAGTAEPAAA